MIRLIAIDLDGTLLDPEGRITDRSREAVRRARDEAGAQVVLVTARTFEEALPFASELGLDLPLLCYHGAMVKDTGTGEVYSHTPLPEDCAAAIVDLAMRQDLLVVLNTDGVFQAGRRAADKHGFGTRRGWEFFDDLRQAPGRPTAIRVIGDESIEGIADAFPDAFGGRLHFIRDRTRTRWILSIVNAQASKVKALTDLTDRLGLHRSEVMAIGDGPADGPMIQFAGVGVAMGNALPEVRELAAWVTATNGEDGVAAAIDRFVLGTEDPA
jgi:Cof subfamily protein (haloacid dehalogenase superfamily)